MTHPCVVQQAGYLGTAKELQDLAWGADCDAEVIEEHPLGVAAAPDVGRSGGRAWQAGPRAGSVGPSGYPQVSAQDGTSESVP